MIRDRVRELRRVRASDLRPNPKNWRTHPKAQQEALRGILDEVGYADALIARELEDGSLELIDGHLRADTTPDQEVPVLVVDVDEAEADKVLATLDPLTSMAGRDREKLKALMGGVSLSSAELCNRLRSWSGLESLYTQKVEAPIYEPKMPRPPKLEDIVDGGYTARLLAEVESSRVTEAEKDFLRQAAARHTMFRYDLIAEYYSHAGPEMKALMEASALVIIDTDQAIERGFMTLTQAMVSLMEAEEDE